MYSTVASAGYVSLEPPALEEEYTTPVLQSQWILEVAIRPGSDKVALLTENPAWGYRYIYLASGTSASLLDSSHYTAIDWAPDGNAIVAGRYDEIAILNISLGQPSTIYNFYYYSYVNDVAWRPTGGMVAAVNDYELVIVDISGNAIVHLLNTIVSGDIWLRVAWSSDGSRLVALESPPGGGPVSIVVIDTNYLFLYNYTFSGSTGLLGFDVCGDKAVVLLDTPYGTKLVVYDLASLSVVAQVYTDLTGPIACDGNVLAAVPGSSVRLYILDVSHSRVIIPVSKFYFTGPVASLDLDLTVSGYSYIAKVAFATSYSSSAQLLTAPAVAVLFGELDSSVGMAEITVQGGGSILQENVSGDFTVYLEPAVYTLQAKLQEPSYYVGRSDALKHSVYIVVDSLEAYTVSIPGYSDLLGRIVITTTSPGQVLIEWSPGSKTFTVDSGRLIIWAAPGRYDLTFTYNEPENVVGEGDPPTVSYSFRLEKGYSTSVSIPPLTEYYAELTIKAGDPSTVEVSWFTGSRTITLEAGETETLYAYPGTYLIIYTVHPDLPYYGDPNALIDSIRVTAEAGESVSVNLRTAQELVSSLTITGPVLSTVHVAGYDADVDFTVQLNTTETTILLEPATYQVTYTLPEPPNYMGPPEALTNTTLLQLDSGEAATITIPPLDTIVGEVRINLPSNLPVTGLTLEVSADGFQDTATFNATSNQTILLPSGEYLITITIIPGIDYIGDPARLSIPINLTVDAGGYYWINTHDKLEIGLLTLHAPEAGFLTIAWPGDIYQTRLAADQTISLLASAQEYTIEWVIDGPENYVGTLEALSQVLTVNLQPLEIKKIDLAGTNDLLWKLELRNRLSTPVPVKLDVGVGPIEVVIPGQGSMEFYVGGQTVRLEYRLPPPSQGIYPGSEVTGSSVVENDKPGTVVVFDIPLPSEILVPVVIEVDEPVTVTIEGPTGDTESRVEGAREVIIYLPPEGSYVVRVERDDLAGLFLDDFEITVHASELTPQSPVRYEASYPLGPLTYALIALTTYLALFHPWARLQAVVVDRPGVVGIANAMISIIITKWGLIPVKRRIEVEYMGRKKEFIVTLRRPGRYVMRLQLPLEPGGEEG